MIRKAKGKKYLTPHRSGAALLLLFCVLAAVVLAGAYRANQALPPYVGKDLTAQEMDEVIARNSPLTSYVHLTANANFPRTSPIQKITIHHMAANLTLENLGESFSHKDRKASSNYAIDIDGNIALYVEEANRAWSSANPENDDVAVTIEVANETLGGDWKVSNKSYEALIVLCTDICRRNGIEELTYTGDAQGTLTTHNMFADTQCPGPYLESRMEDIAAQVNANLQAETEIPAEKQFT